MEKDCSCLMKVVNLRWIFMVLIRSPPGLVRTDSILWAIINSTCSELAILVSLTITYFSYSHGMLIIFISLGRGADFRSQKWKHCNVFQGKKKEQLIFDWVWCGLNIYQLDWSVSDLYPTKISVSFIMIGYKWKH